MCGLTAEVGESGAVKGTAEEHRGSGEVESCELSLGWTGQSPYPAMRRGIEDGR